MSAINKHTPATNAYKNIYYISYITYHFKCVNLGVLRSFMVSIVFFLIGTSIYIYIHQTGPKPGPEPGLRNEARLRNEATCLSAEVP